MNARVDNEKLFIDNKPLFGSTKTWRGILASFLLTPALAFLIGISVWHGFMIAVTAMTGDLCSSFIKRRLNIASSDRARILDQVPESALPYLYLYTYDEISLSFFFTGIFIFTLADLLLSKVLYKCGIRKRPY